MDLIVYLIVLLAVGLVVGALSRLALPGPDPMSIPQTIAIGIAGSFTAGLISWALFGRNVGGLLLAIACGAVIVYFIRRSRGGGLTDPGVHPGEPR